MNSEGIDPVGAQPGDPPWARLLFLLVRLLFLLVQGREGQWWRAILLAMPLLVLVGVITAMPPGWVGGALGVGGLAAALVRRRRR